MVACTSNGIPSAAVTPLGQLPFFTEFLKVSGQFDRWIAQCPVSWTSPNAPTKRDVLGTAVLSILCAHQRYAHISAVRGDNVNAVLLAMEKVVSEDSVRGTLIKLDERDGVAWLQRHLFAVIEPLLGEPWILDTDVTVKPIYGHQEGAVLGYNPHKPGRPSHSYHTYFIANLRLVVEVEAQPGNQTHFKYTVHRGCGNCLNASAVRTGRRWCAVTVTGARRRTCNAASRKVSPTCSSSA